MHSYYMNDFIEFMINNYITIAIIVCVILSVLIFIDVRDIDLNSPKPATKLVEEVTYYAPV